MTNISLSVFPDQPRKMKGLDSIDDSVRHAFEVVDFIKGMNTEWAGDAHFVCYTVKGEERWPRINKTALPGLLRKGGVVEANLIALDYDSNLNVSEDVLQAAGWDGRGKLPKVKWTPDRRREFVDALRKVRSAFEARDLAFPSLIYFTENGARLVHLLSEGVPVQDVEPLIRGMIKAYGAAGMVMDPACVDWTRFFRLPKVMRDGEPTWTKDYYVSIEEDSWLVPQAIEPVGKEQALDYIEVPELDVDQPTAEAARALVETLVGKAVRKTPVYRRAKERLYRRGADHCHNVVVHHEPIAIEGHRDVKLHELIGQAICHLYDVEGVTPQFIYGLFLPSIEQLEPDHETPDWCGKAWDMIKRTWRKEQGKAEHQKQVDEKVAATEADDLLSLLEIMREHYPKSKLLHAEDDAVALLELQRMGIIMTDGDNFHVLQRDGFYMKDKRSAVMLPGMVRDLGMSFLMPLEKLGAKGDIIPVGSGDLLRDYGRQVARVVGLACLEGALLDPEGALLIPLYRRANRRPIFHEEIDAWLRRATTREDYKRLLKWLAYALDFEGGPICALVLTGLPDVGKKLISRGLSECIFGSPQPGSGEDIVGQFTPALLQTPFIVVDEGLPVERFAKRTAADQFRRMVSGEGMSVDRKYRAAVDVRSPVRILFTANNPEIAFSLIGSRTMTKHDRLAIGQRLLHIPLQAEAAAYLRAKGGRRHTAGWIAGDAGMLSDYIVAEHFTWLYENRVEQFGPADIDRFLVEGNLHAEIIEDMRALSGVSPEVTEVCVYLVETREHIDQLKPLIARDVDDNNNPAVYVTTSAVINYYKEHGKFEKQRNFNNRNVGIAMEQVAEHCSPAGEKRITLAGKESNRLRWWKLDLEFLLRYARKHGLECSRMEQILEPQEPQHEEQQVG